MLKKSFCLLQGIIRPYIITKLAYFFLSHKYFLRILKESYTHFISQVINKSKSETPITHY
jgi:hypothetical protein